MDTFPYGAKQKRPGYTAYLGTPDTGSVVSLFQWTLNNGTQLFTYRFSGSQLYYSTQGTGAWTVCGNGTLTAGSHVGHSVLNNTLIISQNGGTTRHSTDGTSFSDTSLAPAGEFLEQYQNRIYITGTSSVLTYSVTGDPTNWQISGTSDSSSFTIPGAGLPNKLFKLADRLFIAKNNQNIYRWDGFALVDMATNFGPSSPYSYGTIEDNGFWINRFGFFTSDGAGAQLISNPVERLISNNTGSAIAGTSFDSAPGVMDRYDYYVAVGSMTDDFTNETVPNAVMKYNSQKNEFLNYSFADFPTAMTTYRDSSRNLQMIFGNSTGQCFTFGNRSLDDNGKPIEAILELVFNFNAPHVQKDWRVLWGFFNPGCEAQISVAYGDTFLKDDKQWQVIGQAVEGVVQYRFPAQDRSRLLFVKVTDYSQQSNFSCYGFALDATLVPTQ